jgi:hypothetical protein
MNYNYLPSIDQINQACDKDFWDFGNEVLYRLCRENPHHDNEEIIAAKVWLIGRSYAAAIERRKPIENEILLATDTFYRDRVAPEFRASGLDNLIRQLQTQEKITENNKALILKTHYHLTQLTGNISGQEKRSFASKYLHFHLPTLFFIYDSRAWEALKLLNIPKQVIPNQFDKTYNNFFLRMYELQNNIELHKGRYLTPRQLDNLLLRVLVEKG